MTIKLQNNKVQSKKSPHPQKTWTDVSLITLFLQGPLIFNPNKKKEVWRFLTYMFVHSGYFHITFNLLVQVG